MANRTSYNAEVHRILVDEITQGQFRAVACRAADIAEETLRLWMKRGKKKEEPFASLRADILAAETTIERECVARVIEKQPGWYLERRFPTRWKPKERHGALTEEKPEVPNITGQDAATKLRALAGGKT